MLNGDDLTPDTVEAGLVKREPKEGVPVCSTGLVLSQALVKIFNNHLEINFKKIHRKVAASYR